MRQQLCAIVALLVVCPAACLAIADVGDLEVVEDGYICATVSDCPPLDVDCQQWTCPDGMCERWDVSRGVQCDDGGGRACDGDGNCVPCTQDNHCPQDEYCALERFVCEADRLPGEECSRDAQCLSNACPMGQCQ